MKKIQVLGSGCEKCHSLEQSVREAITLLKIEAEIEAVRDLNKIIEMGVMITPALAVDGVVVSLGKILTSEQIVEILSEMEKG